jgi:hypothetical protein
MMPFLHDANYFIFLNLTKYPTVKYKLGQIPEC